MVKLRQQRALLATAAMVLSLVAGAAGQVAADSLPSGNVLSSAVDSSGNGYGTTKGWSQVGHTRYVYAYSATNTGTPLFASAVGVKVQCFNNGAYVNQTSVYFNVSGGLGRGAGSSSICGSASGGFQAKGYLYSYQLNTYVTKTSFSPGHNF